MPTKLRHRRVNSVGCLKDSFDSCRMGNFRAIEFCWGWARLPFSSVSWCPRYEEASKSWKKTQALIDDFSIHPPRYSIWTFEILNLGAVISMWKLWGSGVIIKLPPFQFINENKGIGNTFLSLFHHFFYQKFIAVYHCTSSTNPLKKWCLLKTRLAIFQENPLLSVSMSHVQAI